MALARELIPKYKPDLVIIVFLTHDLFENTADSENEAALFKAAPLRKNISRGFNLITWLNGKSHIVNLMRRSVLKVDSVYLRAYILRNKVADYLLKDLPTVISNKWDLTFQQLTELKKLCDNNDGQLNIVSVPQRFQVLLSGHQGEYIKFDPFQVDNKLYRWCRNNNIAHISILRKIIKERNDRAFFFPTEGHINESGHEIIANAIIDELKGEI